MKKFINQNASVILLILAAVYIATQYARVGRMLDPTVWYSEISGFIAGMLVNLSIALVARKVFVIRVKAVRKAALAFFFILFAATPFILAPLNLVTLDARIVGFGRWSISIVSASIVDVAIIVVALVDPSLLASPVAKTETPATTATKPKTKAVTKLYRCECGETFSNRFQYSGHAGRCATHRGAKKTAVPAPADSVFAKKG